MGRKREVVSRIFVRNIDFAMFQKTLKRSNKSIVHLEIADNYNLLVFVIKDKEDTMQRIFITSDYLDSVVSLLEDVGLMSESQVAAYDKLMFPTHISLPYSEKRFNEIHETLTDSLGKVGYTSFSMSIQDK